MDLDLLQATLVSSSDSTCPRKSNISNQNKHRNWQLFKDYYFELLDSLGQQAKFKQVKFKIKSKIFLL